MRQENKPVSEKVAECKEREVADDEINESASESRESAAARTRRGHYVAG